ncbi:MAG: sugar ABC transporter substrate-binding protein [Clostridia bacterium]|nr:sugar ABC transporter substrate-binding protein [Clostridia bacterium]
MKKLISLLLAALFIAAAIAPLAVADEPVTITFAFWDTNQEPGMRAIADAYTEMHPNVTIETQVTPWDEYWTKLEASAQGGAMPDVFWMHSNQFYKYADAGTMLNLNDLNYDYSPYPSGVTALYNFDGDQLAIPKDYDTIALAYNKEIFDNAGIAYPDDTWTWETLRETAKLLTDPENGVYGFASYNTDQSGYLNLIYQNGGFAFENGENGYNLPETKEAIKFWIELNTVDGVSPSIESFVDVGADDQFMAGRVAMIYVGSWMMSAYTNNDNIKDKFDLCVLPMGKTRASIYNGLGYAGYSNTRNPEVVKDFLAFCGTEQANILQAQNKAAIPAYAGTEHYFTDLFPDINIACYPEMIEYGVQYPFSPNKSLWIGTETEYITSMYAGEISVEEGCDELYEFINECEEDY